MQWIEADPMPEECQRCQEEDCYNCDAAGKRWFLSPEDTLRIQRAGKIRAIQRLQQQVKEIDEELERIAKL